MLLIKNESAYFNSRCTNSCSFLEVCFQSCSLLQTSVIILYFTLYTVLKICILRANYIFTGEASEIKCVHQTLPLNNVSNVTDTLPIPFFKLRTKKNLRAFSKHKFCYAIWGWSAGKESTWTVRLLSPPFLRKETDQGHFGS